MRQVNSYGRSLISLIWPTCVSIAWLSPPPRAQRVHTSLANGLPSSPFSMLRVWVTSVLLPEVAHVFGLPSVSCEKSPLTTRLAGSVDCASSDMGTANKTRSAPSNMMGHRSNKSAPRSSSKVERIGFWPTFEPLYFFCGGDGHGIGAGDSDVNGLSLAPGASTIGHDARSVCAYGPIFSTGIGWNPNFSAGDSGFRR